MEDFDIFEFDNAPTQQPLMVDYLSRLIEEREVPDSEPIDVDPVKLSTAWAKAVDRTKDSTSFMSYIKETVRKYLNDPPRGSFTGYARGQFTSSSHMCRTQPDVGIFSRLTDWYPIQPDTGTDTKD